MIISWIIRGDPRTIQTITLKSAERGRNLDMVQRAISSPRGMAPSSVTKKSFKVCTKPVFNSLKTTRKVSFPDISGTVIRQSAWALPSEERTVMVVSPEESTVTLPPEVTVATFGSLLWKVSLVLTAFSGQTVTSRVLWVFRSRVRTSCLKERLRTNTISCIRVIFPSSNDTPTGS